MAAVPLSFITFLLYMLRDALSSASVTEGYSPSLRLSDTYTGILFPISA